MPEQETTLKYCGNCRYAEPSFYLLWCYKYEQNKAALECCSDWEPKIKKEDMRSVSNWWK